MNLLTEISIIISIFNIIQTLIFDLPGTAYGPKCMKIPTLASMYHSGNGLESKLSQSGVYFPTGFEIVDALTLLEAPNRATERMPKAMYDIYTDYTPALNLLKIGKEKLYSSFKYLQKEMKSANLP